MTGSVQFSNHEWLARSYDSNNNQVMDELKVDPRVAQKVDTDGNGQVSRAELVSALKADSIEINQGVITESKGVEIFTHGLETLKNIHSTAKNSWGHVFTPSFFADDTLEQRYDKLVDSNRAYSTAIDRMESSLRSIRDMTQNSSDATSKALHIQAKTTLRSATWRTWTGTFQDLLRDHYVDQHNVNQMQSANVNFQAAYETLNTTLKSIAEQTRDLPDVQGALKATDKSISNAFSNINTIQRSSMSAQDVHGNLNRLADVKQENATGRAMPYAGIGAGVGAVAGGLIGFFAGGKNIKNAMIGAGIGTAVAAGGGGLIGHSIDQKYLGEAKALRSLANDVTAYNPEAAKTKLTAETQNTYQEMLKAREHHDLDNARVSTNNFNSILGRVRPVEQESARILGAYQMK